MDIQFSESAPRATQPRCDVTMMCAKCRRGVNSRRPLLPNNRSSRTAAPHPWSRLTEHAPACILMLAILALACLPVATCLESSSSPSSLETRDAGIFPDLLDVGDPDATFTQQAQETPFETSTSLSSSKTSEDALDVDVDFDDSETHQSQAVPRVLEARGKRKKKGRCRKGYKKYCMHNGKCKWIHSLNKPSCICPKDWEGKRCHMHKPGFTTKEEKDREEARKTNVAIAAVLSCFGFVGILTSFCVCWRRYKHVQKHLEEKDVEIKQKCLRDSCKADLLTVPVVVSMTNEDKANKAFISNNKK